MDDSLRSVSTAASNGGSAAARAYREQLAREGRSAPDLLAGLPSGTAPESPFGLNARRDVRVLVSGRARLRLAAGATASGRMIDISRGGVCVLMEDTLRSKTPCTMEIDVFHNGKRHAFTSAAVCVYAVLAAGKGFKVGFQFDESNAQARSVVDALLR